MTQPAELHPNEEQRIRTLQGYDILDTDPELAFDDLAKVSAQICATPMALVSLVDESRQWFKAKVGLDATETSRDVAFCAHAILNPDSVMQVCDTKKDKRFRDNPLVTGDPYIGFYAGAPLVSNSGEPLGTLCVLDTVSRELDQGQIEALHALSRQVVAQLEMRKTNLELSRRNDELGQFAYRVSHDFKSPLSSSKQLSELIVSDLADNDLDSVRDNAVRLKSQMIKLENFVHEMLNLAKADLADDAPEEVNIEALVRDVELKNEKSAMQGGVQILTDIDSDVSVIVARVRLFQVLDNLISNSVKYKNPNELEPFVKVSCASRGDSVELEIADNGVGIPVSEQGEVGKLFKRFHPELALGSGLGLAIVYKHVKALGATVEFFSSDTGTRFLLRLAKKQVGV